MKSLLAVLALVLPAFAQVKTEVPPVVEGAKPVKVETSRHVSDWSVFWRYLHWMAQNSPSFVSATRSIPWSVGGNLIFFETVCGTSR